MPDSIDDRSRIVREASVRLVRAEGEGEEGGPTRLEITAATNAPVRINFFGLQFDEVLSMSGRAVDLGRLRNNAHFLADHSNRIESILGLITGARVVDNERLVVNVELADTKPARAYARLLQQGMARKVSIGFSVDRWKRTREADKEAGVVAEFTAMRWQPHEVSAVAVAADDGARVENVRAQHIGAEMPPDDPPATDERNANAGNAGNANAGNAGNGNAGNADPAAVRRRNAQMGGETIGGVPPAVLEERQRVQQLREYGAEFEEVGGPDLARQVELNGGTLSDLKHEIATAAEKRWREQAERNQAAGHASGASGDGDPGLSPTDVANFSFVRAARDILIQRETPQHNSHELEVMRAANDRIRKDNARQTAGGFTIPASVLQFARFAGRRNLEAGSGDGANLVATDLTGFVEYLRADSVVVPMATPMPDLVGNQDIPRQDGSINPIWRSESDAASATAELSTDQIELRPKEMILGTTVTRRFVHQAKVGGEMLVRRDLGAVAALGIDYAALLGSGANGQPTGVARTIELGTAPAAGDGGAEANKFSWAAAVGLEAAVDEGNALKGELAFITNPATRSAGKMAVKGGAGSGMFVVEDNETLGFPVLATTQIPKSFASKTVFTGGDKSALLFGDWRQVIVATWVGGDMVVNPYSDQMRNLITISLHLMVDVAVRHTASFAGYWDIAA